MLLKQSTARNRMFYLGSTGLTPTVTVSKNGAAFAALGGAITEVSNSWYKVALNTTDTNTLGDLAYSFSTGTMSATFVDQVVASLPGDWGDLLDLANGVESGWTLRQVAREMFAVFCGNLVISGSNQKYKDVATGAKNRLDATVGSSGRTINSTDPS